jgi:hypothetical protein
LALAAAEWAVRLVIPTDSAVVTEADGASIFEDAGEAPAKSRM